MIAGENTHRIHPPFCHTRGIKITKRSFGPPPVEPEPEPEPEPEQKTKLRLKSRGRIRPRAMKPPRKADALRAKLEAQTSDAPKKTVIAGWKTSLSPSQLPPGAGPLSSEADTVTAMYAMHAKLARQRAHRGNDRRRTRAMREADAAQAAERDRLALAAARLSPPQRELSASAQATIARIRKEEEEAAAGKLISTPSSVSEGAKSRAQPGKASYGAVTFDSSSSLYDTDTARGLGMDPSLSDQYDRNIDSRIRDDIFNKPRRYVACLLDADSLYFNIELVKRGAEGGVEFYQMLTEQIKSHLQLQQSHQELTATLGTQIGSSGASGAPQDFNISLRLLAFANLGGLTQFFRYRHGISPSTFLDFQRAVLHASPWSIFTDAGNVSQATDIKVKAYLLDMLHDSDCLHVYLGGLNDKGYASELEILRSTGRLKRLSLLFLPGAVYGSRHYEQYEARVVLWRHLFSDTYSSHPFVPESQDDGFEDERLEDDRFRRRRLPTRNRRTSGPRWRTR